MVYSITCELRKKNKDYNELYREIKSMGDWHNPLESTWFLDSDLSISEIKERLLKFIDEDKDLLFISRITNDYDGSLFEITWTWLASHIE